MAEMIQVSLKDKCIEVEKEQPCWNCFPAIWIQKNPW